tara:strand:+ start:415 stop:756 length:342 start_codon:yes stop_codon:yes gene_type:complete
MNKNSYNKVILIGHLGADPEGRYTQTGRSVSSFSLATNETWKQSSGGLKEHTEWHNVVAWDKLADFANDYLFKGQLVSVEGSLRTRKWESKSGEQHKSVEILCSNVVPLEWKK